MLPAYCCLYCTFRHKKRRTKNGNFVANFVANSCKNVANFVNFKRFLENFRHKKNRIAARVCGCYAVFWLVEARGVEPHN